MATPTTDREKSPSSPFKIAHANGRPDKDSFGQSQVKLIDQVSVDKSIFVYNNHRGDPVPIVRFASWVGSGEEKRLHVNVLDESLTGPVLNVPEETVGDMKRHFILLWMTLKDQEYRITVDILLSQCIQISTTGLQEMVLYFLKQELKGVYPVRFWHLDHNKLVECWVQVHVEKQSPAFKISDKEIRFVVPK